MAKKSSYVPTLTGKEYMDSIQWRYPYIFPSVEPKGPHPLVDGVPTPGGKPYTGRKRRSASEKGGF